MIALWAVVAVVVVREHRRTRESLRERGGLPSQAARIANVVAGILLVLLLIGGFVVFLFLGNEPVGT
jgi:succinate dehydrogenase hydrophobic anchor subunit